MNESLYDYILSAKYVSIFALMVVFPNETIMPLAGYAAANGILSLPWAIVAGAAGTTFGSIFIYLLARLVPDSLLDKLIHRYGRWVGLRPSNLEKAGRWFDRHAQLTVLLGRFIPGVRTAVSVPAGIRRMPAGEFILYTALGSTICSALLACLGYAARERITEITAIVTSVSTFVYLLLALFAVTYVYWRLQKRHP